jgi:phosphoribosylaminoimidazole (AIR) synthetase
MVLVVDKNDVLTIKNILEQNHETVYIIGELA